MRLHRFFVEGELEIGEDFVLKNEEQIHQIVRVFRLGEGDEVILFDGNRFDFIAEIKEIKKDQIIFDLKEKKEGILPKGEIHLFLASIRKERFEWAVEKATELGVSSITPIITERSEHTNLNIDRLKKIAIEASEQCGRNNVPIISPVDSLKLIVDSLDTNSTIIVADFGGVSLKSYKLLAKSCKLFIGPEGGWTEEERELFKNKKAQVASLGALTLRAETAAISALSILNL